MTSHAIARTVPVLPVADMSRAIGFYSLLGFTARRYQQGDDYAFLRRTGAELHLRRAKDLIEDHNPCEVYFYLESGTAAALEAGFRAAGAPILTPLTPREWKMNEFVLRDPDGNVLIFGEDLA